MGLRFHARSVLIDSASARGCIWRERGVTLLLLGAVFGVRGGFPIERCKITLRQSQQIKSEPKKRKADIRYDKRGKGERFFPGFAS